MSKPRALPTAGLAAAPTLVPLAAAVAGIACVSPRPIRRVLFLAAAATAVVAAPAFSRRQHLSKPLQAGSFSLLSANVWNSNPTPRRAAEFVADFDADVQVLVEGLGELRSFCPPAMNQLVFRRLDHVREFELVVRSKHPIEHVFDIQAGTRSFPVVRVSLPSGPVLVVAVHTSAPHEQSEVRFWRRQLRDLGRHLARLSAGSTPVVVAGDFNATLTHPSLRRLLRRANLWDAAQWHRLGWRPTWGPAKAPALLALDHVLFDERVSCDAVSFGAIPGSDHRFVHATLRPARVLGAE